MIKASNNNCYSCGNCNVVCTKDAIVMDFDLIPSVDKSKCIDCNMCNNVCTINNTNNTNWIETGVGYVAKTTDKDVLNHSSSGGIFNCLAQYALLHGYYVAGCCFDESFLPKHVVSNNYSDILHMMGSKYVKSDLTECTKSMMKLLDCGEKILFSGTPCQVSAVKKLFNKYSDNMIYVAVACHGSIDRTIWSRYISESYRVKEIDSIYMRDKSKGWLNYGLKVVYKNGEEEVSYRNTNGFFLKCYTDGLFERKRCLTCDYKGNSIEADIILGDAWGMDSYFPDLVDNRGASSVICTSPKGGTIIEELLGSSIIAESVDCGLIISKNRRIIEPAEINPRRKFFLHEIYVGKKDIASICKKYGKRNLKNRLINKLFSILCNSR